MTENTKPRLYQAEHYKDMADADLKGLLEKRYEQIATLEERLEHGKRRSGFITGALSLFGWVAGNLISQHYAGRLKSDNGSGLDVDELKDNLTRIRMPNCEKDEQGRPIPKYADQPFKCGMSGDCCLNYRLISDGQLETLGDLVKNGGKGSNLKRTLSFAAATSTAGALLGLGAGRYIESRMSKRLNSELHALKHESIVAENELYHRGHQR